MRPLISIVFLLGVQALAASLEVQVVDATSGKPMAGVRVSVALASETTDQFGKATFTEFARGEDLYIREPEYVAFEQSLTAVNTKKLLRVALTPNRDFRQDLAVRGVAAWEDGRPLPGRVHVACGVTSRDVSVDDEGKFVIERLAPGRCQLRFHGEWRGVSAEQYFTLGRTTPVLSIGPRAGSVAVVTRVEGAGPTTEVFLVAGDAWTAPRTCSIYNDGTGGAAIAWGDPGVRCEKSGDQYACPAVPEGAYTVIARTMLTRTAINWTFNQWSMRLTVGTTAVSAKLPAFKLSTQTSSDPGLRPFSCSWP